MGGRETGSAKLGPHTHAANSSSPADKQVPHNVVAPMRPSSNELRHMDVYCPLPMDLRAALEELAPAVDRASSAHLAAWLSGDAARLCSFEQYADSAKTT